MNAKHEDEMIIRNATVVNADGEREADVWIRNGKIEAVGRGLTRPAAREVDARGKHLFPGFVDLHAHLRTPGREDEEDFASGSRAAAKGGFTTLFCMPNTEPAIDLEGIAWWVREEGRRVGLVDIYPVGSITRERKGKILTEFCALRHAGCRTLSDDGDSLADSLLMRRAFEYAKLADVLLVSHCEDAQLSQGNSMRESRISSRYGISAVPDIAESIIAARDIALAQYTGGRLHLAHVSSAKTVTLLRQARAAGVRVTAETCPHYLVFTVEDVEKSGFDSHYKVNPPLGTADDRAALRAALRDGILDCVATDHAPHSRIEKELPFEDAPFGINGLETAFSALYTHLVLTGACTLPQIIRSLSFAPAAVAGFTDRGAIAPGYTADLVLADLSRCWTVTEEEWCSKSVNTPFLSRKLSGVIECTWYRGRITYQEQRSG
ncbi:MAG: amidohydrolase family protein [Candidatus Omnitrophica bacterium]|nr:amidohydrolase family protein [Candidatus Omnitrophota bacterium]